MPPFKKTRLSGREILQSIYNNGLTAVHLFTKRYGRLQNEDLTRAFTPPASELWVERAAWGELATKYVFWAEYMHNNKDLETPQEIHIAIYDIFCFVDLRDQSIKAWDVTGQQVLEGKLEDPTVKQIRFTGELADLMQKFTRETEKVNGFRLSLLHVKLTHTIILHRSRLY